VARRRKTTKALTAGCVRALDTVLGEAATRTKGVTP
jgi:hypothetical protein